MKRIAGKLRVLHTDQSAQGMVFGAISLFLLAACVGLAHNSGIVTSRRVQTQSAADAAAYAGSLTSANILSDVAWMNDGMAYVYYNLMRYAVDVTVYRTLAEIKEHNYWPEGKRGMTYIPPPSEYYMMAGGDPVVLYEEAYQRAEQMVPRAEKWMGILSDMERALAISGKYLVREAVCRTAAEHGNDVAAVALLQNDPSGTVFLHRSEVEDIDMVMEYGPDGSPLWSITYNGQPYIEIYKHGPNHWEIVRPGVQSVDIFRRSDTEWTIKTGSMVTDIRQFADGSIEVTCTGAGYSHLLCIPVGRGLWAVTGQTGGASVSYVPFRDGGYLLTVNDSTVGIRQNNGKMQQFQGGVWRDVPGQSSVTVGGVSVPVSFSNHIDLPGNASLDFPGRLNLGPISFTIPNQVSFAGTQVTLNRDSVSIRAQVGNVALVIDGDQDNCVMLNGRSTCDPNSATKRSYSIQNVWGHDRIETNVEGRRWTYKWRSIEAIFTREDLSRLGHHAVADARLATGVENEWTEWFDPAVGARKSNTSYYQTVQCWNEDDIEPDGTPDGYVDDDPDNPTPCKTCNGQHPLIDYDQRLEGSIADKDGDGVSDVRKYGINAAFFEGHYPGAAANRTRTFQDIRLSENARPLCLTPSVFAYPLVVAVWVRPDKPFLGSRQAPPVQVWRDAQDDVQARRTGPSSFTPFFRNPEWGYFAVACSRVGVFSSDGRTSGYSFTFDPSIDSDRDFNFGEGEFLDRADDRDAWLASWHNHYEPVWTARLWPLSEAVKSVDMEIAHRQQELSLWEDVSRNFVWRVLQHNTEWVDPNSAEVLDPTLVGEAQTSFNSMRGPRSGQFGVGPNTPPEQLQDALRH
ncbi:MAG TPA: hypothetical protein VM141_12290 [Planctomycetota bacterium]|nr:hypothetical protein [Planctomycetota bacterium]